MLIENLKYDTENNIITWEYQSHKYTIAKKLINANYFEKEKIILILYGRHYVETHLNAYDVYGNFKFEVIPPENRMIFCSMPVPLKSKGIDMGMACELLFKTEYDDGEQYAIDPITGDLKYVGTMRW